MKEIWKDVSCCDHYEVSNYGRVRNKKKGRVLKSYTQNSGYEALHISKNKKSKCCTVHKLVALAFVSNPDNKPQINHIDGDKKNNSELNLEWCTAAENMQHASKSGLCRNGEWTNERRRATSERMSRIHRGVPKTKEHNHKNKMAHIGKIYGRHTPIVVVTKKGKILYDSIRQACTELKISRCKVTKAIDSGIRIEGYYFYKQA